MYGNKYIKNKIKVYNNRINTNFYGNKIPEDNEYRTCLSVILLDSVVKIDNDCYPQIFLEEFKYAVKMNLTMSLIMISLTNLIKIEIVFQMVFPFFMDLIVYY